MHERQVSESPPHQHVRSEGRIKSLGGPYLRPILADIEKSIQEAQRGSLAMKRKLHDEEPVSYDGETFHAFEESSEVVGELSQVGGGGKEGTCGRWIKRN